MRLNYEYFLNSNIPVTTFNKCLFVTMLCSNVMQAEAVNDKDRELPMTKQYWYLNSSILLKE